MLVGVFLPWTRIPMCGATITISGRDWIEAGLSKAAEPYLVLVGGILMIVCTLPAVVVPRATKGARGGVRALGILASIAALLAIGGAIRFAIPFLSDVGPIAIGYGVYVSIAAAVLGLIFGIMMWARA